MQSMQITSLYNISYSQISGNKITANPQTSPSQRHTHLFSNKRVISKATHCDKFYDQNPGTRGKSWRVVHKNSYIKTRPLMPKEPFWRDVFLMIRRHKTTIFTDAKENTTVAELKKMIEGILKIKPRDQMLFNKDNLVMDEEKPLQDYGITMSTAKAQAPAQLGLALRLENGDFEQLELTPYSSPPDLPDVMKNQEAANGQEQVA